jgi:hypothetical protein
VREGEA